MDINTTTSAETTPTVQYELIGDQQRAEEVAQLLLTYPRLSFDTETTGLDPFSSRFLLWQFATEDGQVFIFDCPRLDMEVLRPVIESERVLKILQNAKFDYKMLRQLVGMRLTKIYDTMLAERKSVWLG